MYMIIDYLQDGVRDEEELQKEVSPPSGASSLSQPYFSNAVAATRPKPDTTTDHRAPPSYSSNRRFPTANPRSLRIDLLTATFRCRNNSTVLVSFVTARTIAPSMVFINSLVAVLNVATRTIQSVIALRFFANWESRWRISQFIPRPERMIR